MSSGIILPPPQYDHPFTGRVIYETMPYWKIQERIGSPPVKGRVEGFSWTFPDPLHPGKAAAHVILPEEGDGVTPQMIEDIKRHENAHNNGWSQDHEDGIY